MGDGPDGGVQRKEKGARSRGRGCSWCRGGGDRKGMHLISKLACTPEQPSQD